MKVLISDYKESMMPTHALEKEILTKGLGPDVDIVVFEYTDDNREQFLEELSDADALLTAFIPIDKAAMDRAKNLKIISLNSTGFDGVDLEEADKRGIGVSPVGEYCTQDVSEGALAFLFALNEGLKHYTYEIEKEHVWDYASAPAVPRVESQTIGIVGAGKIGKCTIKKLKHLCKRILVWDPYIQPESVEVLGAEVVELKYLLNHSDTIINHMNLTSKNREFFNRETFGEMKRHPIFINMSRGQHIVQEDLVAALDQGTIRGAGLDVLDSERPELENHPLLYRENVIVTPHSSFYSEDSIRELQRISSENVVYFLKGEPEKVFRLVNLKNKKD